MKALSDRAVRRVAVPLAYLALAIALTWPTVATFSTRMGGDGGDGYQNLWNFWWVKESLLHFQNPFFTDHLRQPFGVTLVFQTFVVPDAIVALPLWAFLPPLGVYNSVLLWSFVLTGLGMYALVRDWSGSRLAAFFAGAAFMATPFHMAHALGHQHLVSIGYLPLYLVYLHRMVRGGTIRDAALGGFFLACAALCSWYQLIFAFGWSLGVFVYAAVAHRKAFVSAAFAKQAVALAGVFLLLTGPLMLAMYQAAKGEPIVGAHDARWYSADVESFFYPNARSIWAVGTTRCTHWTGNAAENGDYLGYTLIVLALVGAWRSGLARAYVVTGILGVLLSLGPGLHVAGSTSHVGEMPYAKLVEVFPGLDFSGVPVRFGLMAQGSLVIAGAFGLAWLLEKLPRAVPAPAVVSAAIVLALVEFWPQPLPTTVWMVPPPVLEWAKSTENFSVLDMTSDSRASWDAIHHGKPCVQGYVTRTPKRLQDWWDQHPVFNKINKHSGPLKPRLTRDDSAIDFDWGEGSPDPGVFADLFAVTWDGSFEVPSEGDYTFVVTADDQGRLVIDDAAVASSQGGKPATSSSTHLTSGVHRLHAEFREMSGRASMRVQWQGPNLPLQVLRPASDTAGVPAAFHAQYFDARVESGLPREEAVKMLEDINLRYILVNVQGADGRDPVLEGDLGLKCIWFGDRIRIYEVPKKG
jgi:hypothetical protein